MRWQVVATGSQLMLYLRACRILNIQHQVQNDSTVLLATDDGCALLHAIAGIWNTRVIPIDRLAAAYQANPTEFMKIVDGARTVLALDPSFDLRPIAEDLLKL